MCIDTTSHLTQYAVTTPKMFRHVERYIHQMPYNEMINDVSGNGTRCGIWSLGV